MAKPKKDLYAKLEDYKKKREAEKEYKRTLFYCVPLGYSRSVKLSAVTKMLKDMEDIAVKYTPEELDALRQGRLGHIVGKPKYSKELPLSLVVAETAKAHAKRKFIEDEPIHDLYGRYYY